MFAQRVLIVLGFMAAGAVVLVVRLFQIQVVRGDEYRALSATALENPPETLWPLRGRILDRQGALLVSDEPAFDVTVHYGVLSMDPDTLRLLARKTARPRPSDVSRDDWQAAEAQRVRDEIASMWVALADASGTPLSELRARRDQVCRRVEGLRQYLWRARAARGFEETLDDVRLAEDELRHAIIRDVSPEVRARVELHAESAAYLRIEPSVRRLARDEPALCHLIGRLGEVSARRMEQDPRREDELGRYLPGERVGVGGVEAYAEEVLRGRRGRLLRDRDGNMLERVEPRDGADVRLTLDLALQRRITAILEAAVAANPPASGAACVVLDAASREVLAIVSVPTHSAETLGERYRALRDDARGRPLLFRAVGEEYPPGSIVKPLALLAGLSSGQIDPRVAVECRGRLFDDVDAWFCWTQWRHLPPHGSVTAIEAIQHSCNIYFYQLGQRVGGARLSDFYREVLSCGRLGLAEERSGNFPTEADLKKTRGNGFQTSDGRNYALGQGEIQITPLQAANLFATLARGELREPTLLAADARPRPARPIVGLDAAAWRTVREGLYRCANEPGGTAYDGARMDDLVVCGKTGSAQCVPRPTRWEFTFEPGGAALAPTVEAAREQLGLDESARPTSRKVVARWPELEQAERGKMPTHAWFAGFAPRDAPRVALALVLEFGGSGGKVAAPVGRQVFEALLESPAGYLTRDPAASDRPRREEHVPSDETE